MDTLFAPEPNEDNPDSLPIEGEEPEFDDDEDEEDEDEDDE